MGNCLLLSDRHWLRSCRCKVTPSFLLPDHYHPVLPLAVQSAKQISKHAVNSILKKTGKLLRLKTPQQLPEFIWKSTCRGKLDCVASGSEALQILQLLWRSLINKSMMQQQPGYCSDPAIIYTAWNCTVVWLGGEEKRKRNSNRCPPPL